MAGALKEAQLTTRNARAKLAAGLYWRQLDADLHLGYRKGAKGGRWLVRWYIGDGNYHRQVIGITDDVLAQGNLSFDQASRKARELVAKRRAFSDPDDQPLLDTVRTAVEEYVAIREARDRARNPLSRRKSDAASRLSRYALTDPVADILLVNLTEAALAKWRRGLDESLKPGSRTRTTTDFKAALNLAHRRLRKRLPADFAENIRFGLAGIEGEAVQSANAREDQILSDKQVRDVIAAAMAQDADGDFGRLVLLLAATGARFSQLQRVTVGDVQPERLRLFMPASRKGRGRKDTRYPVQIGRDVADSLRPILQGRASDEILLCHWRLRQTKKDEWCKERRGPWTSAAEMTRPWNRLRAGLGLAAQVVPYSLRHSSIVRALRSGLPIRLVAAMHDTSVAMIERHYARFIVDGLEELAARAVIPLVKPRLSLVS